jgi:hypothetical protein
MRDWAANKSNAFVPDAFQFTVKSRPFIVMGDLSGVSIQGVKRVAFPEIASGAGGPPRAPSQIGSAKPLGKDALKYEFGGPMNYRSLNSEPYAGRKDLDANFSLSWDKDALTLRVEVEDAVHAQSEGLAEMWRGDSVQVAFQSFEKSADQGLCSEYTLALNGEKALVYREFSQTKKLAGGADAVALDVKREGGRTIYTAKFPVEELGFQAIKEGMLFGFSLLVNDADGKTRKGYLHWGDGIGNSKDPSAYNWIRIEE